MAKISNVIIHCSDSTFGSAAEIRRWHLERGWKDIGYQFVILNGLIVPETRYQKQLRLQALDGSIEVGRKMDGDPFISVSEAGAHALGYNSNSIGICLIGKEFFTAAQFYSLAYLLKNIQELWPLSNDNVLGHYDVARKSCPNFDVAKFKEDREKILLKGVYGVDITRYKVQI